MSLYTRLIGGVEGEVKIPVHGFMAALGEFERGKISAGEIEAAFGLSGAELTEAAAVQARILYPQESISLGGFQVLSVIGAAYDSLAAAAGLGLVQVQLAGITQVIFGVVVNKIGTGIQSWQLWNHTDGAEIGVINDSGATGVKTLSTTLDFSPALSAGLKVVRVRGKSTVAADSPVYFGASLLIRRIERLTASELHEVLLLAEDGSKYGTEAALKARLGIA